MIKSWEEYRKKYKDEEERQGDILAALDLIWESAWPDQRWTGLEEGLQNIKKMLGLPLTVEERLIRLERFVYKGRP